MSTSQGPFLPLWAPPWLWQDVCRTTSVVRWSSHPILFSSLLDRFTMPCWVHTETSKAGHSWLKKRQKGDWWNEEMVVMLSSIWLLLWLIHSGSRQQILLLPQQTAVLQKMNFHICAGLNSNSIPLCYLDDRRGLRKHEPHVPPSLLN